MPEEWQRRATRLKRIREAKRALEERARAAAEAEGKPPAEGKPEAKAQYNFSDPGARILKSGEGFVQAYNAQAAVEPEWQLIVGQAVTQAANDKEQVKPRVEVMEAPTGQRPKALLADSGYGSEKNLEDLHSAEEPEKKVEG